MPLKDFKDAGLLFNSNFLEETIAAGTWGYRGELVLVEGGPGDDKGHSKPPVDVIRGAVLLGDDKLKLLVGAIDRLESLPTLIDKYQDEFAPDMKAVLYVVNIKEPMVAKAGNTEFVLIPLVHGVPWNEVIDELALEKSDFKGQSPADKVLTVYKELADYLPKYPHVTLEEALSQTTETVREAFGAV
jgi:hypothetical protein